MKRSRLLLLLALWLCPLGVGFAAEGALDGMRRWGSGEYRKFGFLLYEATLWAQGGNPLQPPLALKLSYRRPIPGAAIVDASVGEIRKLGSADEAQLKRWGAQMAGIFPDVRPGDHILGLYADSGARFFYNDRFIGAIDDAAFARAFFGIWLDAKTSAPQLRSALLAPPAT